MSEPPPLGYIQRLFRACLLVLGSVLAIWLALQFLAQIWGWLLGIGAFLAMAVVVVFWLKHWRQRRW